MTVPLIILAAWTILLGIFGTPVWPWFEGYLNGHAAHFDFGRLLAPATLFVLFASTLVSLAGLAAGWLLYGDKPPKAAPTSDPLERAQPALFGALREKLYFDEVYEATVVRLNFKFAAFSDWLDRMIWGGAVRMISGMVLVFSWINRFLDEYVINLGFNQVCRWLRRGGAAQSRWQTGQVQEYLRVLGIALAILALMLIWGT